MKNARDVAVKVLKRVDEEGAFAAAALAKELSALSDSRESGLAFELVHGVLRRRPWLDHLLNTASTKGLKKIDPDVMQMLRIGAYQIACLSRVPKAAAVSETVRMVKQSRASRLQGLANALLRKLSRLDETALAPTVSADMSDKELAVRLGKPLWLFKKLVKTYGKKGAIAIAEQFNAPSRRTLRINTHRIGLEATLKAHPELVEPSPRLSPFAVDLTDPKHGSALVEEGLAAHQDEAAQLAVLALDPQTDDRVLDACAGRGGKSAAIGVYTNNHVQLTAVDKASSKLDRLSFELSKQQLFADTIAQDLTRGPGPLEGTQFNRILLDAPCSGSGTLGRRPEIRWRLTPDGVQDLASIQFALLNTAAALLAPSGILLFVTCSILPEEGKDHIDPFLSAHPEFSLKSDPPKNWPPSIPWEQGYVSINPANTHTDGYQMIALTKQA